ncbi:MAG: CBS domain-containing protein [Alphaproteobacteria bacterium]
MLVQMILNVKGNDVVAVGPTDTVAEAVQTLNQHQIGAVLVRDEIGALVGILSERDVVRAIAREGAACLDRPVTALATRDVISCDPEDDMAHVMGLMTRRRFRHLPVMRDGRLIGLVSIGDVVKHRLAEMEGETQALRQYIAAG